MDGLVQRLQIPEVQVLVDIKVPTLAESVADATLATWLKKAGDPVVNGENLIDVETDKVVLEVTAPQAGVLKEIKKGDNETVLSDEVIAVLDTEVAAQALSVAPVAAESASAPAPGNSGSPSPAATTVAPDKADEDDPKLSPAVRKLLEENLLDPAEVEGTGKDGRITKSDVLNHLEAQRRIDNELASTAVLATLPSRTPPAEQRPEPAPATGDARGEKRVPMTRLRKRVAERLVAAQHENAILPTFNEVDMQPVMALRKRHQEKFEQTHGVRLGFMSFFVKAAVEALKQFPVVNASVDGEDIVYHQYFDVGIAVSSPRGLVVPILRDVDRLGFAEIENGIGEYGEKAQDGKLTIEELTGGNFTISNGGIFGSLMSTPIINPPQSAILGMHKIQERPIAKNGQVIVRPMMYLALSYDHRIIDGREAVLFLVTMKDQLEDPARLLLQI
ncbi:MAG: 2-oxoglutarate dehydrogenase complex dihydrolipoyllysine-residue succinyltransferase [Gammaproteobacteria bacterium]